MKYVLPTGIGDSVWALTKIQAIQKAKDPDGFIDVTLVGTSNLIDSRAQDFVRRFQFINSVDMQPFSIHAPGPLTLPSGRYNYLDDGMYDFQGQQYCVLVPNAALEQGIRLEDWLPHYAINWDIFRMFHIEVIERVHAADVHQQIGDYAVFYPGPLAGNSREGHNRNAIWKPADWVELGKRIHEELGLHILFVGASYDMPYFEMLLKPLLNGHNWWTSVIGMTNLGELWALTDRSKFVVSYQAGVGIISTYRGTPTAIFWRQHGDSISPNFYLTFDNKMASSWVPPAILATGKHLPLYYGKDSVESILTEVCQRGWHETPARHAIAPAGM